MRERPGCQGFLARESKAGLGSETAYYTYSSSDSPQHWLVASETQVEHQLPQPNPLCLPWFLSGGGGGGEREAETFRLLIIFP